MKLEMKPILSCTSVEYSTEIEPLIKELSKIQICPNHRDCSTTWNCDAIEDCDTCPFGRAENKLHEAVKILREMEIKK